MIDKNKLTQAEYEGLHALYMAYSTYVDLHQEISEENIDHALVERSEYITEGKIPSSFDEKTWLAIWKKNNILVASIVKIPDIFIIIFGLISFFESDKKLFTILGYFTLFIVLNWIVSSAAGFFREKQIKQMNGYFYALIPTSPSPLQNPENDTNVDFNVPPQDK